LPRKNGRTGSGKAPSPKKKKIVPLSLVKKKWAFAQIKPTAGRPCGPTKRKGGGSRVKLWKGARRGDFFLYIGEKVS